MGRNQIGRSRKLRLDQRGSVLVLFTVLAPVLIGLIGLAVDGGRFLILNTKLQDLAAAAALAGAAELDGKVDAITRATTKAQSLLSNTPKFSTSTSGAQIEAPIFLSAL